MPRKNRSRAQSPLSHAYLLSKLRYEPDTGAFTWTGSARSDLLGKEAGYLFQGYRAIGLNNAIYLAHRLAWFYVHGRWPAEEIDHADRNRSNNRLANLRECSHSQNNANRPARRSRAGMKGVCYLKVSGTWCAKIGVNGRQLYLGTFKTAQEAHEVYMIAARRSFGEFASA